MSDDKLLSEIKDSILSMQEQMQETYQNLSHIKVTGESHDKTVKITLTATYAFEDIDFSEKALQGGVKEFKARIKEAWKSAVDQVQSATQNKTVELLQQMQIPEDIKQMSVEEQQKAAEEQAKLAKKDDEDK